MISRFCSCRRQSLVPLALVGVVVLVPVLWRLVPAEKVSRYNGLLIALPIVGAAVLAVAWWFEP